MIARLPREETHSKDKDLIIEGDVVRSLFQ